MSSRWQRAVRIAFPVCLAAFLVSGTHPPSSAAEDKEDKIDKQEKCKDRSDDPAGCQPSTLDTPIGQMPGGRVNRHGDLDPFASEKAARDGAFHVEKKLRLFRNFEHLHWVITVPSVRDPETGAWRGGDLEADGDARGLGIAGNCLYVGHSNGVGVFHAINIFKIQPDPERHPPVQVGEIPAFVEGNRGFDDRELRALLYTSSSGVDRMLLVRDATAGQVGKLETFVIDPATCQPVVKSNTYNFGGQSHSSSSGTTRGTRTGCSSSSRCSAERDARTPTTLVDGSPTSSSSPSRTRTPERS